MEIWDIYDENRKFTGKTCERGGTLDEGDYHLVVFGIVRNDDKYLITKRAPQKSYPGTWEVTGGSAVTGETSYQAVVREIEEETGLRVKNTGKLIHSFKVESERSHFVDIWLFDESFKVDELTCQEGEVSDIKLASAQRINQMFLEGDFMPGKKKVMEIFNCI